MEDVQKATVKGVVCLEKQYLQKREAEQRQKKLCWPAQIFLDKEVDTMKLGVFVMSLVRYLVLNLSVMILHQLIYNARTLMGSLALQHGEGGGGVA